MLCTPPATAGRGPPDRLARATLAIRTVGERSRAPIIDNAMAIDTHATVLIVEDHPLYRDGLVQMLARNAPQLRCHGVADAAQALERLRQQGGVDLVLADHRLPGPVDGLQLLERIGALYPTAGRVLISGADDARLGAQARERGLMGFLPKSLEPGVWLDALRRILAGDPWFPSAQQTRSGLTPRQALILERVAAGDTNKLIARELGLSERTIKYHLAAVFERVDATGRAEAVARAASLGWIGLPAR